MQTSKKKCVYLTTLSDEQLNEQLYLLLCDAALVYKAEVASGEKSYNRFVDDFIDLRYEVDGDAICRNAHRRNLNVIRELMTDYKQTIMPLLVAEEVAKESFEEVVHNYNTYSMPPTTPLHLYADDTPMSFGSNLNREQIALITHIAVECNLFFVDGINEMHIKQLFDCKPGFKIQANYLRGISLLFARLAWNDLIIPNWQVVLEEGGFIVSKGKGKKIKANTFATSCSKATASRSIHIKKVKEAIDRYFPKKQSTGSQKTIKKL